MLALTYSFKIESAGAGAPADVDIDDFFGLVDTTAAVSETDRVLHSVVGEEDQPFDEPIKVDTSSATICEYGTRALMQVCFPTVFRTVAARCTLCSTKRHDCTSTN